MGQGKKKSEFQGNFEKFKSKKKKSTFIDKKDKPWKQRKKP